MEYRLSITITGHGRSQELAERLLDAFLATHPEVGPVVSGDLALGTLTVIFALSAEDVDEAFERGRIVFADGLAKSGLKPAEIVSVVVEAAPVEELEPDSELQPA